MNRRRFNSDSNCPICKKDFKSDLCPHSITDAEEKIEYNQREKHIQKVIRKIIKDELRSIVREIMNEEAKNKE